MDTRAAPGAAAGGAELAAVSYDFVRFLPNELVLSIFALLPYKTRARACLINTSWLSAACSPRLWENLDLAFTTVGEVSDGALLGAARKALGRLRSLDLSGQRRITRPALVRALEGNAATLSELRLSWLSNALPKLTDLVELANAAPQLTTMLASLECPHDQAGQVLRREGAFAPVQLHTLKVDARPGGIPPPGLGALQALMAAVGAHAGPGGVGLAKLDLINFPLHEQGALATVVDTVLATPSITALWLAGNQLSPASVPLLARVIPKLESFYINNGFVHLLDPDTAPLFAAALKEAPRLQALMLVAAGTFRHAGVYRPVFDALTNHPTLVKLFLGKHDAGEHAAEVGRLLGGMVAANAPALQVLSVRDMGLGDPNLVPLTEALRLHNKVMLEVACGGNGMSNTFADAHMLPAARACRTLRRLALGFTEPDIEPGSVRPRNSPAEAFVRGREDALLALEAAKAGGKHARLSQEQLAVLGMRLYSASELRRADLPGVTAELLAAPAVLLHVATGEMLPLAPLPGSPAVLTGAPAMAAAPAAASTDATMAPADGPAEPVGAAGRATAGAGIFPPGTTELPQAEAIRYQHLLDVLRDAEARAAAAQRAVAAATAALALADADVVKVRGELRQLTSVFGRRRGAAGASEAEASASLALLMAAAGSGGVKKEGKGKAAKSGEAEEAEAPRLSERRLWTPAEKAAFVALANTHGRTWKTIHAVCGGKLLADSPWREVNALKRMGHKHLKPAPEGGFQWVD